MKRTQNLPKGNGIDVPTQMISDDPGAYVLVTRGDCMEPAIHSGDLVIASPMAKVQVNDCVVVCCRKSHNVFIKRLVETKGNDLVFQPLKYRYKITRKKSSVIMHKVTGVMYRSAFDGTKRIRLQKSSTFERIKKHLREIESQNE